MATKLTKRGEVHGTGPVRYRLTGTPDNPISVSIAIDYSEAPVPEHYYVADYFYVENLDPQILLVFGKFDRPQQDRLRNKLEIYFSSMLFVRQLWKSTRVFHKGLRDFVEKYKYAAVTPGARTVVAEKAQTIHSNNVLMVHSGGECMMDFFYLSPRDVSLKVQKKRNLELEPQVRVIIPPTLLLGFLDACEPIVQSLAPKFAGEEEDNETLEPL